jgi:hypothetical protein
MYLANLQYRSDPALDHSVCRNLLCSDQLLLDSADRLAIGDKPDMSAALADLQEALRRNAASPDRWCDLGERFLAAGRILDARYCFTRAIDLGPLSPPVFWRTAQFYARIQELHRSQEYMGKVLSFMPKYKGLVFETYLSTQADVVDTLEHGFVPESRFPQDYFRYLLEHNVTVEDTHKAWKWMKDHSLADMELGGDYVDWLSSRHEYSLAATAWKDSSTPHDAAYLDPNFVFNGSFETIPNRSGLDWRISEIPGVRVLRDSTVAFSGSSSLEMEFDGTRNVDFNSITHDVLAPAGRYHFKAWVRTSGLTTDEGVGFRIVDSLQHINLATVRLTGTHDWTPMELDLTASGSVQFLRIEVVRKATWKFDNKISGRAWIDAVSLVRS